MIFLANVDFCYDIFPFSIWKHLVLWKIISCTEYGKQVGTLPKYRSTLSSPVMLFCPSSLFLEAVLNHWQVTGLQMWGKFPGILRFSQVNDSFLLNHWTGPAKWVSWDETGYSAPGTSHAPVVHSMTHNMFNGLLNVFIFGDDGSIHHIWQTTCDKVPNPWGWCTWSVWNTIGGKVPPGVPSVNPLSIGSNIHGGIEVGYDTMQRTIKPACTNISKCGILHMWHHQFPWRSVLTSTWLMLTSLLSWDKTSTLLR